MATLNQIEANRRNSQLSTGPRTPEGKSVSRFNALKSGINAKAQVIPGEDPAELQAVTTGYHQDWQPATYLERFLVDSLIRAEWLLQRLSRLEAQLWAVGPVADQPSDAPLADTYARDLDRFTRLQRRIDSTERSYYRALNQLQRLRREAEYPGALPTGPAAHLQDLAAPHTARPELASFGHLSSSTLVTDSGRPHNSPPTPVSGLNPPGGR